VVAEGDRVGVLTLQRRVYCFQDAGQVLIDVVVPKSQHAKPIAHEMLVAHSISRGVIIEIVLAAVDFDNEFLLQANEVDDEAVARRLAAEMKAALAPRAQMNPQFDLLWGHRFAQLAGDLIGHEDPARPAWRPATLPEDGEG
jgi:hypothetical protein